MNPYCTCNEAHQSSADCLQNEIEAWETLSSEVCLNYWQYKDINNDNRKDN